MALDTMPATTARELLREAVDALRHSSREMVLLVLTSLRAEPGSDAHLDDAFGRDPSASEYADAVAWNVSVATERRRHLVARSLARQEVADRLDVSAQAAHGGHTPAVRPLLRFDHHTPPFAAPGELDDPAMFLRFVTAMREIEVEVTVIPADGCPRTRDAGGSGRHG